MTHRGPASAAGLGHPGGGGPCSSPSLALRRVACHLARAFVHRPCPAHCIACAMPASSFHSRHSLESHLTRMISYEEQFREHGDVNESAIEHARTAKAATSEADEWKDELEDAAKARSQWIPEGYKGARWEPHLHPRQLIGCHALIMATCLSPPPCCRPSQLQGHHGGSARAARGQRPPHAIATIVDCRLGN